MDLLLNGNTVITKKELQLYLTGSNRQFSSNNNFYHGFGFFFKKSLEKILKVFKGQFKGCFVSLMLQQSFVLSIFKRKNVTCKTCKVQMLPFQG